MTDLSEFISPEKEAERARKLLVGKVADLVERSGVDIENATLKRVKMYQSMVKGPDGEPIINDMISVELAPSWEGGPLWPVIQPAKPVNVRLASPKGKPYAWSAPDGFKVCMVGPDVQIGYFYGPNNELIPTHDETAIDLWLQMVSLTKPDLIVFLGDNLDLPEFSKYRLTPIFARTTQASIDRCGLLGAQTRAAAGDECEIRWLEGNHEFRLSGLIVDNAKAAFGLKKANAPESWPVLSLPNLCDFDTEGIEYLPGYPANETWINNRFRAIHGTHVVSNGSTAHRYLANERVSVIYGHIHRREWAERTRAGFDGSQTILAMSPGCLARVDGAVPSTKGGFDLDGRPIPVVEDWQQGVAVVTYQEGEGLFIPEQVPIHNGQTIYRGQFLEASEESWSLVNGS